MVQTIYREGPYPIIRRLPAVTHGPAIGPSSDREGTQTVSARARHIVSLRSATPVHGICAGWAIGRLDASPLRGRAEIHPLAAAIASPNEVDRFHRSREHEGHRLRRLLRAFTAAPRVSPTRQMHYLPHLVY
jgi:hypothetical protein